MAVNLSRGSLREEAIIIPQQKSVFLIGIARCAAPKCWPGAHSTLQHRDYDRCGAEVSPLLDCWLRNKRRPPCQRRQKNRWLRRSFWFFPAPLNRRVQALPVVELVLAAGDVAGGNGARQGPGWRRRIPSGSVPTSEHAVVPGIDTPL